MCCLALIFIYFKIFYIHLSGKKTPRCFFGNISYKIGDSGEIWHIVSSTNWLQKGVIFFHLTWIMSLHYLVKLVMLVAHVLQLSYYRKKLQNFTHLNIAVKPVMVIGNTLVK